MSEDDKENVSDNYKEAKENKTDNRKKTMTSRVNGVLMRMNVIP